MADDSHGGGDGTDNDSGAGGGTDAAASQSDAQSGENEAQSDADMGSSDTAGYGTISSGIFGAKSPVEAANEALAGIGMGHAGFAGRDDDYAAGLAMANLKAGNIAAAFGWGVVAARNSIAGAIGSVYGSVIGSTVGRLATSLLGITNPYAAATVTMLGVLAGTQFGKAAAKAVADQIGEQAMSEEGFSEALGSVSDSLGEDGSREFVELLTNTSPEELLNIYIAGVESLGEGISKHQPLYRRRSNIIGTGRQGLTIE